MNINHHPRFELWLQTQTADLDVHGELVALITALEHLGDEFFVGYDECHPAVTSPFLFALRRTPPTMTPPYATRPPVIRMLFGLVVDNKNIRTALMVVGGDKTALGNLWYPLRIAEAHQRLREYAITSNMTPFKVRNQR